MSVLYDIAVVKSGNATTSATRLAHTTNMDAHSLPWVFICLGYFFTLLWLLSSRTSHCNPWASAYDIQDNGRPFIWRSRQESRRLCSWYAGSRFLHHGAKLFSTRKIEHEPAS